MTTTRLFFALLLTLLGVFGIVDVFVVDFGPDLWNVFGICSLLALGLALLFGRPE